MGKRKLVEMDEGAVIIASEEKAPTLETNGVSTCIAFVFQGMCSHGVPFVGLYHWSGFSDDETQEPLEILDELFSSMAEEVQFKLSMPSNEKPYINEMHIIGGEKEQFNEKRELLISGTEQEVEMLREHATEICKAYFEITETTTFYFLNYLTSDNEALTVKASLSEVSYSYEPSLLLKPEKHHKTAKKAFSNACKTPPQAEQSPSQISLS